MLSNFLKIALRNISRNKIYSFINISGLAVGMAVCFFISMVVQNELSYDNYHADRAFVFRVVVDVQNQGGDLAYASTPSSLAMALKNDYPKVEHTTRVITNPETVIRYGSEKKFLENRIFHVDPEIFDIFSILFIHGDSRKCFDRPKTVVITEAIALKYFGDVNPLGKLLNFGYAQFEVTAVVRDVHQNSHWKFDFLLSLKPFGTNNWVVQGWDNIDGQSGLTYTYVKLKKNSGKDEFENDIKNISMRYDGGIRLQKAGLKQAYSLQPIGSIHLQSNRRNEIEAPGNPSEVIILSTVASVILLIACLNFVVLTTARSSDRKKEIGLRKALGAQRSSIFGQFLTEAFVVISISFIIALLIVQLSLPWISTLMDNGGYSRIDTNFTQVILLLAIVFIVGLLACSYPAFRLASFSPVWLRKSLHSEQAKGGTIRRALVVFQFTTLVILIIGTLIVYKQLSYMKQYDLGFDKDRLLILPVPVGSLFDSKSEEHISNEFTQHHTITSATTTSFVPGMTKNLFKGGFTVVGAGDPAPLDMNIMMVDHDFLGTYNIQLSAGRSFEKGRTTDASGACLINDAAAKAFGWTSPGEAVGKRIKDFQEKEIIGIVKSFHYQSVQQAVEPMVIMMNLDFNLYLTLNIDSRKTSEALAFLQKKWNELFPDTPFTYHFLNDIVNSIYQKEEQFGVLMAFFSALAIVIACLGLFGLATYTAERRRKEIGIRRVLGSSVGGIMFLLSGDLLKSVLLSNVIGLPIAWFVMEGWLENYAQRVDLELWTFLFVAGSVMMISLITVMHQAIRAALSNPVESLRYE
ncbi:MAG: ABC transporter permease [bacterium]